jgi:hypothetical protein
VPPRSRDRSGRSLIKGSEFTKGYEMTGDASTGARLRGILGTADGKGVVRVEDRFDADIETVWSARSPIFSPPTSPWPPRSAREADGWPRPGCWVTPTLPEHLNAGHVRFAPELAARPSAY